MSQAAHVTVTHAEAEHHETSFITTYVFSRDHKMIGKQFLATGLLMFLVGGLLALMVRWELAWPQGEFPFPGLVA